MMLIPCPWCGERPEGEFVCAGETVPPRPADPSAVDDQSWAGYITNRRNIRGLQSEWWWHVRGCGTGFEIERDTLTHALRSLPRESRR